MRGVDAVPAVVLPVALEVVLVVGLLGAWWLDPARCVGMSATALVLLRVGEGARAERAALAGLVAAVRARRARAGAVETLAQQREGGLI